MNTREAFFFWKADNQKGKQGGAYFA